MPAALAHEIGGNVRRNADDGDIGPIGRTQRPHGIENAGARHHAENPGLPVDLA